MLTFAPILKLVTISILVAKEFIPSGLIRRPSAIVVARVEGLKARMAESERQTEQIFQDLLSQSFGGNK